MVAQGRSPGALFRRASNSAQYACHAGRSSGESPSNRDSSRTQARSRWWVRMSKVLRASGISCASLFGGRFAFAWSVISAPMIFAHASFAERSQSRASACHLARSALSNGGPPLSGFRSVPARAAATAAWRRCCNDRSPASEGLAWNVSRCHARLFRPALGELLADEFADNGPIRRAFDKFDQGVARYLDRVKVQPAA